MISENFINAVKKNDIIAVRATICSRISPDRAFKNYIAQEYFLYAENNLGKDVLLEKDNGNFSLPLEKSLWTEDLWKELMASLDMNFSEEKYGWAYKIMEYLRSIEHPNFVATTEGKTAVKKTEPEGSKKKQYGENLAHHPKSKHTTSRTTSQEKTLPQGDKKGTNEFVIGTVAGVVLGVVLGGVLGLMIREEYVVVFALIGGIVGGIVGAIVGFCRT